MAFKMKKPVFYNVGNEYEKQYPSAVFQQKKTLDDYLNEGFSQVEAQQMFDNQATTGRKMPNDDMAYFNELEAKEKAGKLSGNEKKALARLRSGKTELEK